jgi:hypothetical protein
MRVVMSTCMLVNETGTFMSEGLGDRDEVTSQKILGLLGNSRAKFSAISDLEIEMRAAAVREATAPGAGWRPRWAVSTSSHWLILAETVSTSRFPLVETKTPRLR